MESRSQRTVFRRWGRTGWIVSSLGHAGVLGALVVAAVNGRSTSRAAVAKVSTVEMEAAPPPPPPPPPPEPEPPPPPPRHELPAAPPAVHEAPPPSEAPPLATGSGESGDGSGFATGNNPAGGSRPEPAPKPAARPERPPPPAPAPSPPRELEESELSVKPDIRCSPARIAALYPQAAIDNDTEADIPVDVVVDQTGRINNPKARVDPGFGLREAAERALLVACRPMAIPRDLRGNLVAARVVHTLRFQLE